MDYTITAPDHTERLSWGMVNSQFMLLVSVQGMGRPHLLYADVDDMTRLYYIVGPGDGPMELHKKFFDPKRKHEFQAWNVNGIEEQFAAQRWVMEQASQEVRDYS